MVWHVAWYALNNITNKYFYLNFVNIYGINIILFKCLLLIHKISVKVDESTKEAKL